MGGPWAGKWALVTGASAGIGVALARELAAGGTNLVLTARRKDRLEKLAQELSSAHKIGVEIFAADLAQTDAPQQIFAYTQAKKISVDLLINNAGFGAYGAFATVETQRLLDMVQVNCGARRAAGAGRWKKLCDFRHRKFPGCALATVGAARRGHAYRKQNVPAAHGRTRLMPCIANAG